MIIVSVTAVYNEDDRLAWYEVTDDTGLKHCVPKSESNRHYQEILEWVANGGTIVDNGA